METETVFLDTNNDELVAWGALSSRGYNVTLEAFYQGGRESGVLLNFPLDTARQIAAHINKLVDEMEKSE